MNIEIPLSVDIQIPVHQLLFRFMSFIFLQIPVLYGIFRILSFTGYSESCPLPDIQIPVLQWIPRFLFPPLDMYSMSNSVLLGILKGLWHVTLDSWFLVQGRSNILNSILLSSLLIILFSQGTRSLGYYRNEKFLNPQVMYLAKLGSFSVLLDRIYTLRYHHPLSGCVLPTVQ